MPLTASVSLTWDGTGLVLRSSGHSTGPGDVCKYNDASRQATATGSIELTAGEIFDVNRASAVSEYTSLLRYELVSCEGFTRRGLRESHARVMGPGLVPGPPFDSRCVRGG